MKESDRQRRRRADSNDGLPTNISLSFRIRVYAQRVMMYVCVRMCVCVAFNRSVSQSVNERLLLLLLLFFSFFCFFFFGASLLFLIQSAAEAIAAVEKEEETHFFASRHHHDDHVCVYMLLR